VTKNDVLSALDEIGLRFVEAPVDDLAHYKALCIAWGVAYCIVTRHSDAEIEVLAEIIARDARHIRKPH
jgi:hypothetical protein